MQITNFPKNWKNEKLEKKWEELISIRNYCNVSIEEKRAEKIIGSSLEAYIELELKEDQFNKYKNFDFAEFFITSKVDLKINSKNNEEIIVNTFKAKGKKCSLCWKISEEKCQRNNCSLK